MTTHEILIAARKRIEKPENWGKHLFAADIHGRQVSSNSPEASKWCAIGAVRSVAPENEMQARRELLKAIPGERVLSNFNDDSTHAEVLAAFDRAIAATAPRPA